MALSEYQTLIGAESVAKRHRTGRHPRSGDNENPGAVRGERGRSPPGNGPAPLRNGYLLDRALRPLHGRIARKDEALLAADHFEVVSLTGRGADCGQCFEMGREMP